MAFKIDTQAYKETVTHKPKPPRPNQETQTETSVPKNPPLKKPIGDINSYIPPSSNSAFSSLFLSKTEWLEKEFNLSQEAIINLLKLQEKQDLEILEDLENSQTQNTNKIDKDSFLALLLSGLKK